jgi:hypothetical protein
MTDVIQAGIEKKGIPFDGGLPSPPPRAEDAPDVVSRGVPDAISGSSDEELVRESVKALNRQRDGGPDPFAEQRNLVDVELKYDGRDDKPKSLRQATKDVSDRHLLEKPEAQLAMSRWGFTEADVQAFAKNKDHLLSLGYTPQEADEYGRRLEVPPLKVTPVRDDGRPVRPVTDDEPYTPDDGFRNRAELKRGIRNFRESAAAAQQQLLEALTAPQEQQPAAETAVEQQAAVGQPAQPQPQPQQQQPQQPDPLAVARAELQVERQIRNSSYEEQRALNEINKWVAWGRQNFPELQSVESVQSAPPARLAQLQQAAQRIAQGVNAWMSHGAKATEARQSREQQLATHHNALIQHTYKEFSKQQDELFSRAAPEMADTAKAHALRTATQRMLRDVGFAEDEVQAAWQGRTGVPLRDHRVQLLLRDAAMWRQAQARANQVTRAPIPPVQRPGTIRPRGAGNEDQIRSLERELGAATGAKALRLATRLLQLKRAG